MIDFVGLKALITKACKVNAKDENFQDRYHFTIQLKKLETLLATKANLHVLYVPVEIENTEQQDNDVIESWIPEIEDIQLVSEYIHDNAEFKSVFNGKSQIATLVLYLDEGAVENKEKESSEPSTKVFTDSREDLDEAVSIVNNRPVYNTLIVRRFNPKNDRFEYRLHFRSNYNMMDYRRDLTNKGNQEVAVSAETTTAE